MHRYHRAALAALAMASAVATVFPAAGQSASPGKEQAPAAVPDNGREGPRERMRERMRDRADERRPATDRKLTSEQVRDIVEGRLAMSGNPNLKVGKVAATGEGVVSVDIVTKTGALVATRQISTRSGLPVQAEAAREARGQGMRGGGRGEMRGGMGAGMRGGMGAERMTSADHRDLKLTIEQTRKLAEARLIMNGNPNLKVGAVKEKDADTITVDIVAADNSLVEQQEIDRHTGRRKRS